MATLKTLTPSQARVIEDFFQTVKSCPVNSNSAVVIENKHIKQLTLDSTLIDRFDRAKLAVLRSVFELGTAQLRDTFNLPDGAYKCDFKLGKPLFRRDRKSLAWHQDRSKDVATILFYGSGRPPSSNVALTRVVVQTNAPSESTRSAFAELGPAFKTAILFQNAKCWHAGPAPRYLQKQNEGMLGPLIRFGLVPFKGKGGTESAFVDLCTEEDDWDPSTY